MNPRIATIGVSTPEMPPLACSQSAKGSVVNTWMNSVPAAHWVDNGTYPKVFFGLRTHNGAKATVLWKNIQVKQVEQ